MHDRPFLSVIVPIYNVEAWLPRCLDSILGQTYPDFEILAIDDGSTDNSPVIVDRYAAEYQCIRVIHQRNQGLARTREIGIKNAKGKYIGFVDGDDEIVPSFYERLIENALRYDAQISECSIQVCYPDGRKDPSNFSGKVRLYTRYEGCKALLEETEIETSLCNKVYLAEIMENSCLDFSVSNGEDSLRNIVAFERADRVVKEDFCGYLYSKRAGSLSTGMEKLKIGEDSLRSREIILSHVGSELKKAAQARYVQGAINSYNGIIGYNSDEAELLRGECRAILKEHEIRNHTGYPVFFIKALMIVYSPRLYDCIKRMFIKRRKRMIQKQVEQVKTE